MRKLLLIAAFLCTLPYSNAQVFQSKHFTIKDLSNGVYAAIATEGGYAICNAGIVDLGDAALIFDPFMTPEAAKDLKRVASQLTGHKVKYVVNSHYHNDHIGGDQVFNGASIISSDRTRDLIAQYQGKEIADAKTSAPKSLEKIKAQNTATMTPHALAENRMWTGYYEALVSSVDSLKVVLPDVTFGDQLVLYGSRRNVILSCYGTGHTESDVFLYLPEEQIAFLGDLLFIQNQPWLGDGDIQKWNSYLDQIALLNVKTLVPGHGPVGTTADISAMKLYFEAVKNAATVYHQKGKLPQEDTMLKSPPPFDTWYLSIFYKPNVIGLYNQMFNKK